MTVFANAKINLTLYVGQKQDNGYHSISTLMQEISLSDVIDVEKSDTDAFYVTDSRLPCDESNLCVKALYAFREYTGITHGVRISLCKRIPFMAGLGGGSSDAAAVLKALDGIFGTGLSYKELISLAATLGSDVPFFVGGGCRKCTGRGERVSERYTLPRMSIVVAKGENGLSTPEMYRELDIKGIASADTSSDIILHSSGAREAADALYNSFDAIACEKCPEVSYLKRYMLSSGAVGSMLCGSGSAVFGIFETHELAQKAASDIARKGFFAEACKTVE